MTLYLVESVFGTADRAQLRGKIEAIRQEAEASGVRLVEVQASEDGARAFFILAGERSVITERLRGAGVPIALFKQVRLVGKELEQVEKGTDVNYLVEWNIPDGLTMDQYLERKKKNGVHYAEVPEVTFSRTYVCEDMTKCLCFYQAPDEAAVKRAREAVSTPIDSITKLSSDQ